jgi:hypothetical protein
MIMYTPLACTNSDSAITASVMPGSELPVSLKNCAKVGTTNQNMITTATTATTAMIAGYTSAEMTLPRLSRGSFMWTASFVSSLPSSPLSSPVRMTSIQCGSKTFGCWATASCSGQPAFTFAAISRTTAPSLRLWACDAETSSVSERGMPACRSVESCWKRLYRSSPLTGPCCLAPTRAWAMSHACNPPPVSLPPSQSSVPLQDW